ncbi:MAG: undecaprenyldiphospho-muramoylpentapeptide beta-N-acetylglucosaminyltransferase [Ignavibacteria bacterium]|nr:undecaprenyldiphospho-muramoylpentapeptide beta-N-acetylglucosaminyltransferase [Ignavibacteria bacterium]
MRAVFTGGGTGGHIFPAIAIADSLKKKVNDIQILFIGAKGKMEERIVPENNYNIKSINIEGLQKGKYNEWLLVPFKFIKSVNNCGNILKEFKPSVVVATGGFVSAPVVYAALRMKCKVVLQEGNAVPGKVTKYFSGKAHKVIINFEETVKHLKRKDNVIKIAYPIRVMKGEMNKSDAMRVFEISNDNKTLFAFGGSQGSAAINKVLLRNISRLSDIGINIIWQTGKKDYEKIKNECGKYSRNIKVYEFIDKMYAAYTASDLVICRAGISSIMEIAAFKKPSVLIPYPFASDNHQEKNARALQKENACKVLIESEIEEKLYDTVKNTIYCDKILKLMSNNIFKFSDPDSADKISNEIIKITL